MGQGSVTDLGSFFDNVMTRRFGVKITVIVSLMKSQNNISETVISEVTIGTCITRCRDASSTSLDPAADHGPRVT